MRRSNYSLHLTQFLTLVPPPALLNPASPLCSDQCPSVLTSVPTPLQVLCFPPPHPPVLMPLQVLYFTPPLREALLQHKPEPDAEFCLTCELSFLFRMMITAHGTPCQVGVRGGS